MPGHAFNRRGVEQVGVVLQRADQVPILFGHLQHQVEWRSTLPDVDGFQVKAPARRAGPVGKAARLFPGERDLEQRRAAPVAHRRKPLDEQREGIVLVGECAQHGVLDATEQDRERRVVV